MQEIKLVYTVKEAARIVGCRTSIILRAISDGRLPAAKIGDEYRISYFDLNGYWPGEIKVTNAVYEEGKILKSHFALDFYRYCTSAMTVQMAADSLQCNPEILYRAIEEGHLDKDDSSGESLEKDHIKQGGLEKYWVKCGGKALMSLDYGFKMTFYLPQHMMSLLYRLNYTVKESVAKSLINTLNAEKCRIRISPLLKSLYSIHKYRSNYKNKLFLLHGDDPNAKNADGRLIQEKLEKVVKELEMTLEKMKRTLIRPQILLDDARAAVEKEKAQRRSFEKRDWDKLGRISF